MTLFDDESIYRQYRYTAYFTTLKLSSTEVWRIYRNRADAENRIKELKYDFGFSSFNMDDFYATEAALIICYAQLTGAMKYPDPELVRLAIPRRVYTQSHLDYVVNAVARIAERKTSLHGYEFEYAPELLRHFTARFLPL